MLTKIVLHGRLAALFGREHHFAIDRPVEALRALECAFPGKFLAALKVGEYRLRLATGGRRHDLTVDMLAMRVAGKSLHIIPKLAGGKRGGAAKVVLGVALVAAAVAFAGPGAGLLGADLGATAVSSLGLTYGNIAMMGVSMALQGAASLLSPQPKAAKSFEAADRRASFLFQGPVTAVEQGGAVPVIYGRMRVGGTVISAALTTEDMAASGGGGGGGALTVTAMEPAALAPGETSAGGLAVTSTYPGGQLRLASVSGGAMLDAEGGEIAAGGVFSAAAGAAGLRFRMAADAVGPGNWVIEALAADGSASATQTGSVPLASAAQDHITGAKGGGKSGGGGGRVAQEDPNTLRAKTTAKILYLIGEGELELVDGGKSIYLDDTPVIAADGSANIDGVTWEWRSGLPDQPHIAGFGSAESEANVGAEIKKDGPVVRTITDENADAARVTIQIPALTRQDKSSGDLRGGRVDVAIDVRSAGGGWVEAATSTIEGKCTAPYPRSFRVALPPGGAPWDIRARRLTDDHHDDSSIQDRTYWSALATVVDGKFSYPDCALLALTFDAEKYDGRLPTVSVEVRRVGLAVPSNYDPATRSYAGVWDGTFARGAADNPAWALYNMLSDERYGLGRAIRAADIDKWGLHQIAQYCDQLVPSGYKDGAGADILEPRFTFNTSFASREEAFSVVQAICSAFRGMAFWAAGSVFAACDMPDDPVTLAAPANVIDGVFTYSGTGLKARHSVAKVAWIDPADGWRPAIEVVEEPDLVARYGWRETDVTAVGCTRRSQARRLGRWLLLTGEAETHTVTYGAGLDHVQARPGQIVSVADPAWAGVRMGGRLRAATPTSATLDAAVLIEAGKTYTLAMAMPDGSLAERPVTNAPGETATLAWAAPLDDLPVNHAVWVLTASDAAPRQFRVRAVRETAGGRYEVTALLHDPTKYDRIEQGLTLEPPPTVRLDGVPPPQGLTASESRYVRNGAARSRVTLSWDGAADPLLTGYGLVIRWPSGRLEDRALGRLSSIDIDDAEIGEWLFSLRAKSLSGGVSRPATLRFQSAGWEDIPGLSVSHLTVDGAPSGDFVSRDPKFAWRGNFPDSTWEFGSEPAAGAGRIDPRFRDYVVRVYDAASKGLLRTEYTTATSWVYTLEMNRQDARALGRSAARRRFVVGVAVRDTSWRESKETRIEAANEPPAAPVNLRVMPAVGAAHVLFDLPNDGDFAGSVIHLGASADFEPSSATLAARGMDGAYVVAVDPNTGGWIKVAHYDVFGEDGILYSPAVQVAGRYVVDEIPPEQVTGLALTTAMGDGGSPQIAATWEPSVAADLAYYETAIKPASAAADQWQFGRVSDPTCVWSAGLAAGAAYQVKVRAVDTSTNPGAWSAAESVVAARDAVPPGPITGLTATAGFRSVWLAWTNPADADYSHAEVWEGEAADIDAAVRIGAVGGAAGAASVLDRSGLEPGSARYYWLRPVDTSDNKGDWTGPAAAVTASLQLPDFPADFGPIPTGTALPAGASAGAVDLFLKLPEVVLWRWKDGGWQKAVKLDEAAGQIATTQISDGAVSTPKLAAGSVTAGVLAAGSVTADKLTANAVTAGAIQAGAITAEKISSGVVITSSAQIGSAVVGDANISNLDASKLRAGTALAGSITVNGQSLGAIQQSIGDPAAAVNAGVTQIDPGKIRVSGGTTLADWRQGGDETKINGGAISANTITANKLKIGMRGVYVGGGLDFYTVANNSNAVYWTGGNIQWIDDAGAVQLTYVSGGSAGGACHIYWERGAGNLSATTDYAATFADGRIRLASFYGNYNVVAHYGGTVIDGARIVTESIRAANIAANAIQASHISAGSVQAQHVAANTIGAQQIVAGAVSRDKLGLRVIGAAQIDDLAVDTLHIAGQAVTIPYAQTDTNAVAGNGQWQLVSWIQPTLKTSGWITFILSARQSYTAVINHEFRLRLNGEEVLFRGGSALNDYPTMAFSRFCGPGSARIDVEWRGFSSGVTLLDRTMIFMGTYR